MWKRRFDLVLNEGLNGISFSFIMTELMIPIMVLLLDYLLIPYFSSLLLLRICVWADTTLDYAVQTLIARYSYAIHLLLRICCYMLACAISYAQKRLDAIRDARYLLARELTNRPSSIVP